MTISSMKTLLICSSSRLLLFKNSALPSLLLNLVDVVIFSSVFLLSLSSAVASESTSCNRQKCTVTALQLADAINSEIGKVGADVKYPNDRYAHWKTPIRFRSYWNNRNDISKGQWAFFETAQYLQIAASVSGVPISPAFELETPNFHVWFISSTQIPDIENGVKTLFSTTPDVAVLASHAKVNAESQISNDGRTSLCLTVLGQRFPRTNEIGTVLIIIHQDSPREFITECLVQQTQKSMGFRIKSIASLLARSSAQDHWSPNFCLDWALLAARYELNSIGYHTNEVERITKNSLARLKRASFEKLRDCEWG